MFKCSVPDSSFSWLSVRTHVVLLLPLYEGRHVRSAQTGGLLDCSIVTALKMDLDEHYMIETK